MKITTSNLNGKHRVNLSIIYKVLNENTVRYCNALRDLYDLGFSDSPYCVDEISLRQAFIEEFEDSKLLIHVSSGSLDFDKQHLKYAMLLSKDKDFVNACGILLAYIESKEKLEICGEILDNAKIIKKSIAEFSVRFVASEGVTSRAPFRLIPEIFTTEELSKVKRVNLGDCVIHTLMLDLGVSEEEYQEYLKTGKPFFVKGVSQEDECELIDLILAYGITLDGEYGSLLSNRILDYYRDYMLTNESKFAQASYESIIFTKSANLKTAKLNKVREEVYKQGGKDIFIEDNNVYYCIPDDDSEDKRVKNIKVGGWCLDDNGDMIISKDIFNGVQGVFSFTNKFSLPAYIDGYGLCYFAPNPEYVRSTHEEQYSAYDSVSPSELQLLVKKFVSSTTAKNLILAVLHARCDEFDFNVDLPEEGILEEEYYNACEEAIQALQYTFNII